MTVSNLASLLVSGMIITSGCGSSQDDDPSEDAAGGFTVPDDNVLGTYVAMHDGVRMPGDFFSAKEAVYFATTMLVGPLDGAEHDFVFRVVDATGTVVSTDDLGCRRVRVDATGRIATLYSPGATCPHVTGRADGGVTVGLAPFDDTLEIAGAAHYRVELSRADSIDGFGEVAMSAKFAIGVAPPPEPGPVCGDGVVDHGEACDDGNASGMDGCDSHCQVEHLCCCGNGVVEPGEQCDDGNSHDADGCSSSCQISLAK